MLQKPVKVGFAAADAIGANFGRVQYRSPTLDGSGNVTGHEVKTRTDCVVAFVVRHDDNSEIELFSYKREGVALNFSWINAAFRAEAWAAYKAENGYTEV